MANSSFNPQNIPAIVTSLRPGTVDSAFFYSTEKAPIVGESCFIYAIKCSDDTIWAVRVPIPLANLPIEELSSGVQTEVGILKRLELDGFRWSPKVLGFHTGFANPIAFPYIVYTWIEGTPLIWSDTLPPHRNFRDRILEQMAEIILELADCSSKPDPEYTATQYLHRMIDFRIARVGRGMASNLRLRDCFIMRALARKAIHPSLEESPMVLAHKDLNAINIMVDADYNITGILDWGLARAVPLQFGVALPRFLQIEPSIRVVTAERDKEFDLAFSKTFLQPTPTQLIDRQKFFHHVLINRKFDTPFIGCDGLSLAQAVAEVVSAPNVDWRQILLKAVEIEKLHEWLPRVDWLLEYRMQDVSVNIGALNLEKEVEEFWMGVLGGAVG